MSDRKTPVSWKPHFETNRDGWVSSPNDIERSISACWDSWSPMEFDWEKGEHPWLLVGHDDDGFFVVVNGCKITREILHPCSCQHCNHEVCLAAMNKGVVYDLVCDIAEYRASGKKISNRQGRKYLAKYVGEHLHGDQWQPIPPLPQCIEELFIHYFPEEE